MNAQKRSFSLTFLFCFSVDHTIQNRAFAHIRMPRRQRPSSRYSSTGSNLGTASTKGMPRLDPQHRLLSRFYEPLVLLHTLGRTRGERVSQSLNGELAELSAGQLRRAFLNHLAYSCDYDKGGDTVTAVALESSPQGPRFWLSANKGPGERVKHFLEDLLQNLRELSLNPENVTEKDLELIARNCISFGRNHIKKYWSHLNPQRRRCLTTLLSEDSREGGLDTPLAFRIATDNSNRSRSSSLAGENCL